MAVPNTTTFSLQDVVNEVNPTFTDLVSSFTDANADYFNPLYEGSKNNLLNFRDYGEHNAPAPIPDTPTGLNGYQVPTRRAKYTWNASDWATSYQIAWNTGGLDQLVDTGLTREWTSPEQNPDVTVYARVRAYNDSGYSAWSSYVPVYMN